MIIINTLEHSSPELSRSLDREEGQKDPELKFGSNFLFEGDLSLIFHFKKVFSARRGGVSSNPQFILQQKNFHKVGRGVFLLVRNFCILFWSLFSLFWSKIHIPNPKLQLFSAGGSIEETFLKLVFYSRPNGILVQYLITQSIWIQNNHLLALLDGAGVLGHQARVVVHLFRRDLRLLRELRLLLLNRLEKLPRNLAHFLLFSQRLKGLELWIHWRC